jgi:putative membrane protein
MPPFRPHLDVIVVLGSVVAAYVIAGRRHERETGDVTSAHVRRLFAGGMAVLFVGSLWPIHDLAERDLYLVHMVQHMLYTLVAAPLIVAGIPSWLWRRFLSRRALRRTFGFLTRPVVALVVFNGILLFTHWPAIVERSVASEPFHFALHAALFGAAILVWWPIVSPLPEMPPITPPAQLIYLFAMSLAPTIPASFLTFGRSVLYPVYATFPRIWGIDALTDQLIAGLIMKLGGTAILWSVMGSIFFRWARREQDEGWDALQWRDVEAEIRSGARR